MSSIDFTALGVYAAVLVGIGVWGFMKVKDAGDFYVAGGKAPWWLAGVSHHVSGYSAVVFTGYATIAYHSGVSIYLWWAVSIGLMVYLGSYVISPRWARLRGELGIQSPTTYLASRYGLPTQQLIAWLGVLLKLLDVAAKWVAIATILYGFVGVDLRWGILIGSGLSLLYIAIGGFWADLANDFFQFLVQIVSALVMLFAVVSHFGGWEGTYSAWQTLPAENRSLFTEKYDAWYTIFFAVSIFMNYNGGNWNLAMRFISAADARQARRGARLSAVLYLFWPLVLFLPMWLSPLIFPGLSTTDAEGVYSLLAEKFIPAGLFGLVLGGMIATTLTMTASDTNAISAVITQDILPVLMPGRFAGKKTSLLTARLTTLAFMVATVLIALNNDRFGGINGLIISWFGSLIGPAAVPLILGLLPTFKRCNQTAAIATILVGFGVFVLFKIVPAPYSVEVGAPSVAAVATFALFALANRGKPCPAEVDRIVNAAAGTPAG